MPLERNTGWIDSLAEKLGSKINNVGGGDITVNTYLDGEKVASNTVSKINDMTRRTGISPLL